MTLFALSFRQRVRRRQRCGHARAVDVDNSNFNSLFNYTSYPRQPACKTWVPLLPTIGACEVLIREHTVAFRKRNHNFNLGLTGSHMASIASGGKPLVRSVKSGFILRINGLIQGTKI